MEACPCLAAVASAISIGGTTVERGRKEAEEAEEVYSVGAIERTVERGPCLQAVRSLAERVRS